MAPHAIISNTVGKIEHAAGDKSFSALTEKHTVLIVTAGVVVACLAFIAALATYWRKRRVSTDSIYEALNTIERRKVSSRRPSASPRPSLRCGDVPLLYGSDSKTIDFVVPSRRGSQNNLEENGCATSNMTIAVSPCEPSENPEGFCNNIPMAKRLSISNGTDTHTASLIASASNLFGGLNPELYRGTENETSLENEEHNFPDDHIGRLWFGLDYDAPTERLLVKVIKAKNLPSRVIGSSNCCDPFIRIYLMPDERRYMQSKCKKKTRNPVFDETYVFQIPPKMMEERVLKFTMLDSERGGKKHTVIGHVTFPLRRLDYNCGENTLVTWRDLEKTLDANCMEGGGEFLISLAYHPNLERLTVTILEVKGLAVVSSGECSAKLSLQVENKTVKTKHSKAIKNKTSKFMESFTFHLSNTQLANACVVIKLMTSSKKDSCVGRVVLGSYMYARGKALQHWSEMQSVAPKQVQQWHKLA